MNIFYISKYSDIPSPSTTGSRGFHLCKHLSLLGHDVIFLTTLPFHLDHNVARKKTFFTSFSKNFKIYFLDIISFTKEYRTKRILSWFHFEFKVIFYLYKYRNRIDVIIASSLSLFSIISALLFKFFYNKKVVFEVRDIWPLSIMEQGGFSKFNPFIILCSVIEKLGYRFSDHIVGSMPNLSEHVSSRITANFNVSCIPMGFSDDQFSSLSIKKPSVDFGFLHSVPRSKFIVGYAGSFGVSNALDILFMAAVSLLRSNPNIHFIFVGQGPLKNSYIKKYGGLANVTIGPYLPKNDVPQFIKCCDLLAISTKPVKIWRYGHSLNKLIDYMISAKPVLFLYDGFENIINDSNCGFIESSSNVHKVINILKSISKMDPYYLRSLGLNGYSWLIKNRHFSLLAKKYEKILLSIF